MNSEKKEFLERKTRVMDSLSQGIEFLKSSGFENEAAILSSQYENVKNEEFVITVVGEFSSGKSCFLNALMGEKILPSYSGEATAVINFLRHKEKSRNGEAGCVYYKDGSSQTFDKADEETITKYACTRGGDSVVTNIDHLDIYLESKFLEDNVTLVDTPGLNGLKEGLADLTRQQIEKSSASIFMFNARQPGSATNFEALAMLRRNVNSIFIVLNAIDYIDSSNGETVDEVIKTLEDKYKKDFPDDKELTKFHPISAKKALAGRSSKTIEFPGQSAETPEDKEKLVEESGMPEFEDYLFGYLTKGPKGRQILLGPAVQLNKQLEHINDMLDKEYELLSGKVDAAELDKAREELENAAQDLQKCIESKKKQITITMRQAEDEFAEEIEAQTSQFVNRYLNKINNFTDIEDIIPENIHKSIDSSLKQILNDAFNSYSRRLEEIVYDNNVLMDNELLSSLNINNFKMPDLRDLQLTTFESGLEEYEKQLSLMRRESDELRVKIDEAEDQSFEARKLANQRRNLEKKIESYVEEMHSYKKDALINMPNIVKSSKTDIQHYDRDGFFGGIADKVFGRKTRPVTVDIIDTSARDDYKKQMNENISSYNAEISKLESQAAQYRGVDPELAERAEERLRKLYEEKRKAELEFQKQFAEKIKATCARQLRVQKEEITDFVQEVVSELINSSKSYFKSSRTAQANVIGTILTRSLSESLEEKYKEIDTIKRQAIMQENEREQRLQQLDAQLRELRTLRLNALDLKEELEEIDVFEIE